ncbi:MAG: hypothetical protein H8E66_32345 [Planctomycetes bacterium]|nr:hypothetical protein [Planctomycetota bacterium]
MSDPKTRHRRYRHFSLRTSLVVLTLVVLTLVCVWLGWQVNRANHRRQAVAWVLQLGCSVSYDYAIYDAKPPSAEWLRDFYDYGVYVDLRNTPVLDLTPLANLKSLQELCLWDTPVTDLTPLANLKSLKWLDLSDTQVSEEQFTKLRQALPNCSINARMPPMTLGGQR